MAAKIKVLAGSFVIRGEIPQLIYPLLLPGVGENIPRQGFYQAAICCTTEPKLQHAMHSPQLIKAYQIWYAFSIRTTR